MSGPELGRLLGEIGLLAAGYGLSGHAHAIMAAVHDLSPASAAPAVGAAIALMTGGRDDEAVDLLERALPEIAEHDRHAVSALLGWALRRAGRHAQSERVLRALVAGSNDPGEPAIGLAAALLDQTSDRR